MLPVSADIDRSGFNLSTLYIHSFEPRSRERSIDRLNWNLYYNYTAVKRLSGHLVASFWTRRYPSLLVKWLMHDLNANLKRGAEICSCVHLSNGSYACSSSGTYVNSVWICTGEGMP